jgi:Rrf2 family iron-sulfur cluster assembly transcriptional regulator
MFSQTTEYALRATTWLALTPGRLVSTSELAERTKVPMHYLAKVLQQLATGGLVTGRRGVGGGYKLARAPEDIRLIEIVRCVSPLRRDGVPNGNTHESEALRALDGLMDRIAADVVEVLDDKRLSDLVADVPAPSERPAAPTRGVTVTNGKSNGHAVVRPVVVAQR